MTLTYQEMEERRAADEPIVRSIRQFVDELLGHPELSHEQRKALRSIQVWAEAQVTPYEINQLGPDKVTITYRSFCTPKGMTYSYRLPDESDTFEASPGMAYLVTEWQPDKYSDRRNEKPTRSVKTDNGYKKIVGINPNLSFPKYLEIAGIPNLGNKDKAEEVGLEKFEKILAIYNLLSTQRKNW